MKSLKALAASAALFPEVLSGPLWAAAPAPSAPASPMSGFANFLPIIAVFAIFYFLLIRPQQKQSRERQKMVDNLKRGDRILTQGGLYATVAAVKGKVLEVKLNEEVKVLLSKSAVAEVAVSDPSQEPEIQPSLTVK